MVNIRVIGGGAAGIFGAIAAAEANPAAQVSVYEAGAHCLSKVLISGGGRCNVTHACFEPAQLVRHYPRGGKALRGAFTKFQPQDTVQWFEAQGVRLKTEADGRMFPVSDRAETIAEALLDRAAQAGVQIYTRSPVQSLQVGADGWTLQVKGRGMVRGDRVLLATGSSAAGYRLAQQVGHALVPPVPSLFTFNVADNVAESPLHDLAGVAIEPVAAQLTCAAPPPLKQTGAVLVTHWGLSGPAILKLSAWGARALAEQRYQATLRLHWVPNLNGEQVRQALLQVKQQQPKRAIANANPFDLPKRFWRYLLTRSGINPQQNWAEQSKTAVNRLQRELTQGEYQITGKGVFKDEFVTCGGVPLAEVNFKTMMSRRCPGLFFAGEVLDIDGVTGGFNFQSAWTTGWLAGQAMGQVAS